MIAPKQEKQSSRDELRARALVRDRDGGVCVRCRRPGLHTNWDHRLNRSQGGRWAASNGQLLCGSGTTGCHGEITGNPHAAIVQGWAVPSWQRTPAEYPAARWLDTGMGTVRLGWVLYDDAGGWTEIDEDEAHLRMTGEWPAVNDNEKEVGSHGAQGDELGLGARPADDGEVRAHRTR